MSLSDWFADLFNRIGDYAYNRYLESESRYFNIIFRKFEKRMKKDWKFYGVVADEMQYEGKFFNIRVIKKKESEIKLINYPERVEITE